MRGIAAILIVPILLSSSWLAASGEAVYSIGTISEEGSSQYVAQNSDLEEIEFENAQFAIRSLRDGEVDFLIGPHHLLADSEVIAQWPTIAVDEMFDISDYFVAIIRSDNTQESGNDELRYAINSALADIHQRGTAISTHQLWFSDRPQLDFSDFDSYDGAWPTPTEGGTLHRILYEDSDLGVCMLDQESPMTRYGNNEQLVGFEVDMAELIMNSIASHYEVELSLFTHDSGVFDNSLSDLSESDLCDVAMSSVKSDQIPGGFTSSSPYHVGGTVILSSSESPEIDSAAELFDSQQLQEEESEFDLRIFAIFILSLFIVREVLRKD